MTGVASAILPEAPRYLGLALIGAGVLSLIVSGLQCRWMLRYLRTGDFEPIAGVARSPLQTPIYFIIIVMVLIGVFAFGAVLIRAI
jgi:putative membrane protein